MPIGAVIVITAAIFLTGTSHQIAVDRQHLQPLDGLLEAQPLLPFMLPGQLIPQGEGIRAGQSLIDDDLPASAGVATNISRNRETSFMMISP